MQTSDEDLPTDAAPRPAAGASVVSMGVPAPPTPLLGREAELRLLKRYLRDAWVHLITLTGCAGVGKTRLAVEATRACTERFWGGVLFVDLADVTVAGTDPALALTLAAESAAVGTPPLPLARAHGAAVLLVLDAAEVVPGAGRALSRLLAARPDLKVLVTSRVALRVRWEHQLPLRPLPLPPPPASTDHRSTAAQRALLTAQSAGLPLSPRERWSGCSSSPDSPTAMCASCGRVPCPRRCRPSPTCPYPGTPHGWTTRVSIPNVGSCSSPTWAQARSLCSTRPRRRS